MRIWKLIKTSETDVALKEEYEFLINGETITHICVFAANSRTAQGFVYMVTDANRIRKISMGNYQIVKEKMIPSLSNENVNEKKGNSSANLKVLSLAINNQGKLLLVVCNEQVLIMD